MSSLVPNELNVPKGGIALAGRDPGYHEVREGRPFVEYAPAGKILADAMTEAGLTRRSVNLLNVSRQRPPGNRFEAHKRADLESEIRHLHDTLRRLEPSVIVALGNEACHALIPDWPDARDDAHVGNIKGARGIEERRGYIFDSYASLDAVPVVATVHPAYIARSWSPWRVLLAQDLQRARRISRDGLVRPTRDVEIIGSDRDARRAVESLRRFRVLSSDIETWRDLSLACIGFAGQSGSAYVFPAKHLNRASELLRSPEMTTIWANGIYDLFVLRHREGVDFRARVEDVQLQWHSAYPELAGAREDKKKHRYTRKSLAFLASLAVDDAYWKGDYETEEEFYIYNGKDVAITLDVFDYTSRAVADVGAQDTYERERRLMWPCVDMLARGLNVDESLRRERVKKLTLEIEGSHSRTLEAVRPLLERERERLDELGVLHLFQETDPTCECCGHGSRKQMACWSCVGFESAPTKAQLIEKFNVTSKTTKAKIEEEYLPICHACCGHERETRWTLNANSSTQMTTLLYDVLRLPKRMKDGSPTSNEQALKSLLGVIPT